MAMILALSDGTDMAGKRGKSGRRPLPGRVFRVDVRFRPGRHSAELLALLEMLAAAGPEQRADILDATARGGFDQAEAAASAEAAETAVLLEDMFGG